MKLNSKQKKWLKELQELWNYCDSNLNSYKLKTKELRFVILLHLTGSCHKLIRGFIAQLNGGSNDSLEGLLRSLIESIININYILADDTNNRAKAFIVNGIKSRLAAIGRILKLMEKGSAPGMSEITNIKHYKDLERNLRGELSECERLFGKENINWPNIETRSEKGNSEELYATAFWLFSEDSHVTAEGINRHMVEKENVVIFNTGIDSDRLDHQIQTAYCSYIAFVNTCSKNFNFPPEKELEKFNKSEMLPHQSNKDADK